MESIVSCCISGCPNTAGRCPEGTEFYSFLNEDTVSPDRRSNWITAICARSLNGPHWFPTESSWICSEHFVNNRPASDPDLVSFVPTLFPTSNVAQQQDADAVKDDVQMTVNNRPASDPDPVSFVPTLFPTSNVAQQQDSYAVKDDVQMTSVNGDCTEMNTDCSALLPCQNEALNDTQLETESHNKEAVSCQDDSRQQACIRPTEETPLHGECHIRTGASNDEETCVLREAFRQLACTICPAIVTHSSMLRIDGTIGVTVDGGMRVILLHFSDCVFKNESQNEARMEHSVNHNEEVMPSSNQSEILDSEVVTVVKREKNSHPVVSDDKISKVVNGGKSETVSFQNSVPKCASDASAVMDLSVTKSESFDAADGDAQQTKPQRTLLRELLCSPLPPKRLKKSPLPHTNSPTVVKIGEVTHRPRSTANSTVLGQLLKTGNSSYISEFHPVITDLYSLTNSTQPVREASPASRRGSIPRRRGYTRRGVMGKRGNSGSGCSNNVPEYPQVPHHRVKESDISLQYGSGSDGGSQPGNYSTSSPVLSQPDYHYSRLLHCLVESKRSSSANLVDVPQLGAIEHKVGVTPVTNDKISDSKLVAVKSEIVDPSYSV